MHDACRLVTVARRERRRHDVGLVSAIDGNGDPRNRVAERDGVALAVELVRPGGRARLVLLALEVGGLWTYAVVCTGTCQVGNVNWSRHGG